MRKLYTLIIAVAFTLPVFAQSSTITAHFDGKTPAKHFLNGTEADGYITGLANDFQAVKAQLFDASHGVDGFGTITGVYLNFAKISNTLTDSFFVEIMADNNGTPGSVLATEIVINGSVSSNPTMTIPNSSVEYNVDVDFSSPVAIAGNKKFWVAIRLVQTFTAELGLYATQNNQFPDASTHTFTRGQGLTDWDNFKSKYNRNIALAVFPKVDYNTGLEELDNDGADLAQNYPNPFSNETVVSFSIDQKADVNFTVFDITGKEVINLDMGEKTVGTHNLTISANQLGKGVYYYTLTAGKAHLTKKMIVQ